MTAPSELYRDSGQAVEASKQFMTAAQRVPTLFDLEDEAYRLMAMLEANDVVADVVDTSDSTEVVEAQLALIDQMLMEKTESYVSVIRSLEAIADAREFEERRLKDRKQSARKHAEWLKARLLAYMKSSGRERIETARFSLSVRQNNPHVDIDNEPVLARVEAYETMPDVPAEFVRVLTYYKVDKRAILAQVKTTGEVVSGATVSRTERLEVR